MNGEEMEGNGPEEMKTKQTSKQLSFGGAGSFEILKVIWLKLAGLRVNLADQNHSTSYQLTILDHCRQKRE